jgi:hypothetical protein
MRKITFYLLGFILLPFQLYAQIPNGDFENWTTGGAGEVPNYCMTSNVVYKTSDMISASSHPASVIKTSPGFSANYALTLQNVTGTTNGLLKDTVPGFATFISSGGKEGFPVVQRFNSLKGYYKFIQGGNPANHTIDTATITISVSKWNYNTNSREILGKGKLNIYVNALAYTEFNLDLSYQSISMPDSAQISISSSSCKVKFPGTSLTVDKLTLEGISAGVTTGLKNNSNIDIVSVYPNPAVDEINIKNIPAAASIIDLMDLTGKVIQSTMITSDLMNIKTNALSSGMYSYSIINKTGEIIFASKIYVER